MALAETKGVLHTIRVNVAIVNLNQESEAVFSFLGEVSRAIFPEWEEAETWPTTSLKKSWDRSATADREAFEKDPDRVFVRHAGGGVTSSVYGIPPDLVVYEFTTTDRCIPFVKMGNPIAKIIC
ncbi:MAG: hypothetical protein IID51_14680 [Proteobacteria bacterium]|nr:hypothetical protein [Pseudomonadota bacterium]